MSSGSFVASSPRPVGHITELIKDLDRWAVQRERKQLDTRPLRRASAYLSEYRALLNQRIPTPQPPRLPECIDVPPPRYVRWGMCVWRVPEWLG